VSHYCILAAALRHCVPVPLPPPIIPAPVMVIALTVSAASPERQHQAASQPRESTSEANAPSRLTTEEIPTGRGQTMQRQATHEASFAGSPASSSTSGQIPATPEYEGKEAKGGASGARVSPDEVLVKALKSFQVISSIHKFELSYFLSPLVHVHLNLSLCSDVLLPLSLLFQKQLQSFSPSSRLQAGTQELSLLLSRSRSLSCSLSPSLSLPVAGGESACELVWCGNKRQLMPVGGGERRGEFYRRKRRKTYRLWGLISNESTRTSQSGGLISPHCAAGLKCSSGRSGGPPFE
jgi:hypothetical protein